MSAEVQERQYVKMSEVQKIYGVSRHSIYRYEREGRLKVYRGTGVNLIKVSDLTALIEGPPA